MEAAERIVQAQFLSNWTLVRLPDRQVGVFIKRGTLYRVTLPGQTGVDIAPDTELEIIKHPAELALEAMERYYAQMSAAGPLSHEQSPPM